MTENIRVTCLVDRFWDHFEKEYEGTEKAGVLIDISAQQIDGDPDLSPVGIVMFDDGTFQSVPMEFIQKEEA